jgi:hypothetical protein
MRTFATSRAPGSPSYAAFRKTQVANLLKLTVADVETDAVPTTDHVIAVNTAEPAPSVGDHPMANTSARSQATGEAKYTQDTIVPDGTL